MQAVEELEEWRRRREEEEMASSLSSPLPGIFQYISKSLPGIFLYFLESSRYLPLITRIIHSFLEYSRYLPLVPRIFQVPVSSIIIPRICQVSSIFSENPAIFHNFFRFAFSSKTSYISFVFQFFFQVFF